jgi:hypothetical protein
LRGKSIVASELGLKIIFSNASFEIQASGYAGDNPKLHITTDIEIEVIIGVIGCVDGAVVQSKQPSMLCDPSTPLNSAPLSGISMTIGFSNTSIETKNLLLYFIGEKNLENWADAINNYTLQNPTDAAAQVNMVLTQENGTIQTGAQSLAGLVQG